MPNCFNYSIVDSMMDQLKAETSSSIETHDDLFHCLIIPASRGPLCSNMRLIVVLILLSMDGL
jgi:hypothetical protein